MRYTIAANRRKYVCHKCQKAWRARAGHSTFASLTPEFILLIVYGALLKDALKTIPNVVAMPAPDVEILTFTLAGPVLAVRPYCNNKDYWQVYFDTNRLIKETVTAAGFAVPETHYAVRGDAVGLAVA